MKKITFTMWCAGLGTVLVLAGLVCIMLIMHARNAGVVTPISSVPTVRPADRAAAATETPAVSGEPVGISIPSLHINLAIIPGTYNARTRQWTLTLNKVQYASMTPMPNTQGGNTFLYGHYRSSVFATLHTIQPDAQAMIMTSNGRTFYYQLSSIRIVKPEDSSAVFSYSGPPILTLQTCTGLFFQNRQLFTFNLVRVG